MDQQLKRLLGAAEAHGKQSEADHEVGDLRQILFSCWALLSPANRRKVYEEHRDLVEEWVEDNLQEEALRRDAELRREPKGGQPAAKVFREAKARLR